MNGHERLVNSYLALHPESASRLLESMPVEQANAVLGTVDAPVAAPVLGNMLATYAARCIEEQPPADAAISSACSRLNEDAGFVSIASAT